MKTTINKFLIFFVSITFFFSCGEPDKVVYDTNADSSQTLVKFNQTTQDLGVVIDESGSIEIQVDVSTKSTSDRTFQVNLLEDQSIIINEINLTYDETVTIPAGEFTGSFTVSGSDEGLTQDSEALYVFELIPNDNFSNYVYENTIVQISGFRVCPVPEDFLIGTYQIEDVSSSLAPGLQGGTTNFQTGIVTLQEGDTPLDRTFSPVILPGILGSSYDMTLSFRCGNFVLQVVDLNAGCSDPTIKFGPSDNPSTYDVNNIQDSYIINYKEDIDASCLPAAAEGSFLLTKIEE